MYVGCIFIIIYFAIILTYTLHLEYTNSYNVLSPLLAYCALSLIDNYAYTQWSEEIPYIKTLIINLI